MGHKSFTNIQKIVAQVVDNNDKVVKDQIAKYAQEQSKQKDETVRAIFMDKEIVDKIIDLGLKVYKENIEGDKDDMTDIEKEVLRLVKEIAKDEEKIIELRIEASESWIDDTRDKYLYQAEQYQEALHRKMRLLNLLKR